MTNGPGRRVPPPPSHDALPARAHRNARRGEPLSSFAVHVEVVTPILGGGTQPRKLDAVDVIRPSTVRGHLRFWWRALFGHEHGRSDDLFEAESERWGKAAADAAGRSPVEIRVDVEQAGGVDESNVSAGQTAGAYALWPARGDKNKEPRLAPRRRAGTQFCLTVRAPRRFEPELRDTVRAWLLFGGYGGRTRRGLGSFTAIGDAEAWLPAEPSRDAVAALFGRDILATPEATPVDTPWLAGAALHVGQPVKDAEKAWTTALEWIREFRQGTQGAPEDRARDPHRGDPQRPSVSNWPEADKVRHLTGKIGSHPPRHNAKPAWPRAGFGLPIVGRFQKQDRRGGKFHDEPDDFKLQWRKDGEVHERLASPLVLKAMPLAGGRFVPCALWFARAYPKGEVFLVAHGASVPCSNASFDTLVAPNDAARFSALAGQKTLRDAFLDWLHARYRTEVLAP